MIDDVFKESLSEVMDLNLFIKRFANKVFTYSLIYIFAEDYPI